MQISVHFKEPANLIHALTYNFGNIIVRTPPPPPEMLYFFQRQYTKPLFKRLCDFSQGEAAIM